ncbi:MAG: class I SAM-dependent methyltransferase [Solirubrobacterales bacterium]
MPTGDWRSQILEVNETRSQRVIGAYTKLAPVYELWARLTEARPRRRVLELAAPHDREAVLEVAIGTGAQLVELARRSPSGRVVGVELADGMLAQARKRLAAAGAGGQVELVRANALELPFGDRSFDLLVNSYMLDLLPRDDIPRALAEFRRVMRAGGRIVLSNMTVGERPSHRVWDALYARGVNLTANCRGVLAVPVLEELGFEGVRREYTSQFGFPTEIVTANKPDDRRGLSE